MCYAQAWILTGLLETLGSGQETLHCDRKVAWEQWVTAIAEKGGRYEIERDGDKILVWNMLIAWACWWAWWGIRDKTSRCILWWFVVMIVHNIYSTSHLWSIKSVIVKARCMVCCGQRLNLFYSLSYSSYLSYFSLHYI